MLECYLTHYSNCYGKPDVSIEPSARKLLLTLPWDVATLAPHKVMECLVRTCDTTITEQAIRNVLSQVEPLSVGVQDYERKEIQRLLADGVTVDQISKS